MKLIIHFPLSSSLLLRNITSCCHAHSQTRLNDGTVGTVATLRYCTLLYLSTPGNRLRPSHNPCERRQRNRASRKTEKARRREVPTAHYLTSTTVPYLTYCPGQDSRRKTQSANPAPPLFSSQLNRRISQRQYSPTLPTHPPNTCIFTSLPQYRNPPSQKSHISPAQHSKWQIQIRKAIWASMATICTRGEEY